MDQVRIGIIGGTGALATGLALRWARCGHPVMLGSRDPSKAKRRADELSEAAPGISGGSNQDAASFCDLACLTVPWTAHEGTLGQIAAQLRGKILIEPTVPLKPPKVSVIQLPEGGSLAAHTQAVVGAEVRVVAALHNVSAERLADPDGEILCDVLVSGNDADARSTVIGLVEELGLRGFHAGPIGNSAAAEALTSILIGLNARYRAHGAGIRFTGLPDPERPHAVA